MTMDIKPTTHTRNPFKLYTAEEARAEGIECMPQDEEKCPFCGKALTQVGNVAPDGKVHWLYARECDCEGQKAENERLAAEERREREEARRRSFQAKLANAGIARMYYDATVSQRPCIDFVRNYADGNGRGLYIVGGVGAGKTYEASAIASSFVWSGYTVIACTSLSMLDQIYANQHGQQTRGTEDFCGADLLIVDDLGKENANQWAVTTLFQVVDSRYANLKPTVFTSQYPLQSLISRMSRSGERESAEAIVSRIAGSCDVVQLRHGDRRRRS
jgi:DNA replication protein DnaC/primosomal protein DnaI